MFAQPDGKLSRFSLHPTQMARVRF